MKVWKSNLKMSKMILTSLMNEWESWFLMENNWKWIKQEKNQAINLFACFTLFLRKSKGKFFFACSLWRKLGSSKQIIPKGSKKGLPKNFHMTDNYFPKQRKKLVKCIAVKTYNLNYFFLSILKLNDMFSTKYTINWWALWVILFVRSASSLFMFTSIQKNISKKHHDAL